MLFWLSIFSLQLLLSRFRNLDLCLKRHISLAVKNNLMESTSMIIGCDFRVQVTCYTGGRVFLFFFIWVSFMFSICFTLHVYFSEDEIFFGFCGWQVVRMNFSGYCNPHWIPKCVWKSRKLNQELVLAQIGKWNWRVPTCSLGYEVAP